MPLSTNKHSWLRGPTTREFYADPRVFDDDFAEVELLYREGEMQDFLKQLTGATGSDGIHLSGSSGVGKSLFASKAIDRYQTRSGADRVHIKALGKMTAGILRAVRSHERRQLWGK